MELREWRLGMDWTQTPYRPPLGLPQYWRDETTGDLQMAVLAYLGYKGGDAPAPQGRQIELLRAYIVHYIQAPCWVYPNKEVLEDLGRRAEAIESAQDIGDVVERCLEIGLDPL